MFFCEFMRLPEVHFFKKDSVSWCLFGKKKELFFLLFCWKSAANIEGQLWFLVYQAFPGDEYCTGPDFPITKPWNSNIVWTRVLFFSFLVWSSSFLQNNCVVSLQVFHFTKNSRKRWTNSGKMQITDLLKVFFCAWMNKKFKWSVLVDVKKEREVTFFEKWIFFSFHTDFLLCFFLKTWFRGKVLCKIIRFLFFFSFSHFFSSKTWYMTKMVKLIKWVVRVIKNTIVLFYYKIRVRFLKLN